jgi:ATP-dependent DNA ligase
MPPVEPMLATSVPRIPLAEGMRYEPKWDGFRTIIFRDGDEIELVSRGGKTMTRYFPDVVDHVRAQLPRRCVVDGEIVVVRREPGAHPRLDFEVLQQRIHPAASRVKLLAGQTPADFVAFDLLALDDHDLMGTPYEQRRSTLATALAGVEPPVHVTPTTTDPDLAGQWFEIFEGAGLDGLMAKPADIVYAPGKRLMYKIKHARTADVVVAGFRYHKSGPIIGSLLLGLFDEAGRLHHVGVSASFTAARRKELLDELAPYRERATEGHPWLGWLKDLNGGSESGDAAGRGTSESSDVAGRGTSESSDAGRVLSESGARLPGAVSRWTGKKDLSWEPLRAELVAEVGYDAMEGDRFRHTAQFKRWRPDRTPESCGYDQLDRPVRFDVDSVLAGRP